MKTCHSSSVLLVQVQSGLLEWAFLLFTQNEEGDQLKRGKTKKQFAGALGRMFQDVKLILQNAPAKLDSRRAVPLAAPKTRNQSLQEPDLALVEPPPGL